MVKVSQHIHIDLRNLISVANFDFLADFDLHFLADFDSLRNFVFVFVFVCVLALRTNPTRLAQLRAQRLPNPQMLSPERLAISFPRR